MSKFRCNKWQDHDGVWHYQLLGPGRTRRARRKWQREAVQKPVTRDEAPVADPQFEARLGYLAYLVDHGIIRP
jgi:hypothetical protein